MYKYIANLFYFGFKRPLIEALKELSKINNNTYRMGIQTKLMNTIYIILNTQLKMSQNDTHKIIYFPVDELINHYKKNQQQREKEKKKKNLKGELAAGNGSIDESQNDLNYKTSV
jgi:hypothetical protein